MTTLTRQDLNFGQVVADVLSEFLEVAVHLILYVREVYPVGIFQKRKKYNVPVQMSCHPELNQYIQDTLHCVKPLLEKNDVEKVVVVILDKEHRPVEKFVFEITQPPLLSINCFEPSSLRSACVMLCWTTTLQAAHSQSLCTQEKPPLGIWRKYRSSRTSHGSWQMNRMSTCMTPA
ncbi:mitotic spindle assembly checkpoint protein MAD2B isoform X2 [Grammomys surdaster]|uniref:mitotic spindle assembly checkpoint protein MAD2B isoform X2 n=1 Tax=Grammomys surdaster TaxID=491861 RepID=UPI00109F33F1|nr:mitotic spindle assembly checkpoint protein MAD2B isoform X2 [Grammomys surdaster]